MNKGMNFPCTANMHFSSTSVEAALLVDSDLKSVTHSINSCSFNCSLNKYLLSAYYMPNTVLGTQATHQGIKQKKNLFL